MFENLLRRVLTSVDRVRVGFVSEPTAIAAIDPRHRKIRALALADWKAADDRNGEDDAVASIDTYSDGKTYAVIVSAGSADIVVVALDARRDEFSREFLAERASRVLLGGSIREARINPPPPPPPPGHPPWELIGRLDAMLRVSQLPVISLSAPVDKVGLDVRPG